MPDGDHTGQLLHQLRTLRDANRRQREIIETLRQKYDELNEVLQETLVSVLSRGPMSEAVENALQVLESNEHVESDCW